jgi:hypothetical protein
VWLAKRGEFEWHKRLMFIATLNLLGPVYTRLGALFEWWGIPAGLIATALTWVLPALAYDLVTRRSIHRATVAGPAFSFASFALMVVIVTSPVRGSLEPRLFT